ncbi:MAG TPA: apolipoprotein N-acyltransferase [Streptosporangiaceae bacterium]|jgi:apolipoprotein N-acyltransferase
MRLARPAVPLAWRRPARWAALVAGAIPTLAFPAPGLSVVAWFALVPGLLIIARAPSAREAAVRAWWLGSGYIVAAMYWLAPEIGPGVLLVAAVFGVLQTPFGLSAWALLRPPLNVTRALGALIVVPSGWLLAEWLRSWQALGGPWAVLGASQWQHPAVLALAAVGGVWLVSFVLVAANVAIVVAVSSPRSAARAAAAVVAAAVVAAGPLTFALTGPAPVTGTATIALVQPGVVDGSQLRVDASQRLTGNLAHDRGPAPDLIVWGESSVAFHLESDRSLLRSIEKLSAIENTQILVNQDSEHDGSKSKVAVLVGPGGIAGSYTKTRLVPFGEYIPFRSALSWLTDISRAAPVNMVPGTGAHVLQVTEPDGEPLTIGPLICFESAFPDMSRVDTDHGAQVIVYQTADSTFQGTWALAQHAALDAVRAAETGRPVVQAALTGDSDAFDARGRQLAWMNQTQRGVITVRLALPAPSSRTIYDQLGDYIPWAATGVVLLAGLGGLWRLRGRPGGKGGATGADTAECEAGSGLHVPS